jgi:hypothetical protein
LFFVLAASLKFPQVPRDLLFARRLRIRYCPRFPGLEKWFMSEILLTLALSFSSSLMAFSMIAKFPWGKGLP